VDIADQIEERRSGIHEAIASEVRQRVEKRLTATGNGIAAVSPESFPANDRPGGNRGRPSK
jgi:hypothetical protein